jgi:hypothetical protein
MKNPLLLLAVASLVIGGCQSTSPSGPTFVPGMARTNFAIGFASADASGDAYVAASDGGVPSLIDNELNPSATVANVDSIVLSASHGILLTDQIEIGAKLGLGLASSDNLTEEVIDFDGDGFNDRSLANGATSSDDTYVTLGGYSRYYPVRWGSIAPWVQADFGFAFGDFSGMYIGASLGTSWFMTDSSAIEARIYGEKITDSDALSGVGFEIGYSVFN